MEDNINQVSVRSDEVVKQYKLKEYLDLCIDELSDKYINSLTEKYPIEYSKLIQRQRNMLLSIKAICKHRNKF